MGAAESLYDRLDSQQCTDRDNQAGFDAGCSDTQQGTRSECYTWTRPRADPREMRAEGGGASARTIFAERRSDFFCADAQKSRHVSRWNHSAGQQETFLATCVAKHGRWRGREIEELSEA